MDFGVGDALALHGPNGPVEKPKLPPVRGGRATSDVFTALLPLLLEEADVVVEDPTVGSSGVERAEVARIVSAAPCNLFTLSGRAVKNYRKDHGLGSWHSGANADGDDDVEEPQSSHAEAAEILYRIATEHSERLKPWNPETGSLVRVHRSVRPHDKRNYRGEVCDRWMGRFPPFRDLPVDLRILLGNDAKSRNGDYSRARAMPLAMALDEPGTDTRSGYERVLGLYDHGYPSFYRRITIELMQLNAKRLAGVARIGDVPPPVRKEAWKLTRKQIRQIYHLLGR